MTAQAPRLFTYAGLAVALAAAGLGLPAVGTARAAGSVTTVPCATGCTYADQNNIGEVDFPPAANSAQLIMRGADGGNGGNFSTADPGGAGGAGGTWTVTVARPTSGKLFLYLGSTGGSGGCTSGFGAGGSSGSDTDDGGVTTGGDGARASGGTCAGGGGGGGTFVTDQPAAGSFDQTSVLAVAGGGGGGGGGSSTSPGGRGGDGGHGAASEDGQPNPGTSGGLSGNNDGEPGGGFPSGGSDDTTDGGGGGGGGFVGGGSGTNGGGGGGGCQFPQTGATQCVPEEAGVIRQAHAARHAKPDAKPHRSAPPTPAAAPKAIAVPASLAKPDPPRHKRVHIAALGQGQVQVVFPGNTPPINPPPPAGHHGSSSNDPGVDASNDPDRQRPDTDQMVCSPLAGICSVNPPPGANTLFTISASGGNESATLFGTLYGGSHPSCPGYTPVTDDWVAFGFRDASAGRSWHKAGTLTTRQSLGRAGAAAQLRRLQICFAAPYRFRTGAGYRMGRDGDGEWTGVLPSCRAAAAPCVSHRSLVRQGTGWVARIEFRAPAGKQDPKALG
jgi:hypothetical protein